MVVAEILEPCPTPRLVENGAFFESNFREGFVHQAVFLLAIDGCWGWLGLGLV